MEAPAYLNQAGEVIRVFVLHVFPLYSLSVKYLCFVSTVRDFPLSVNDPGRKWEFRCSSDRKVMGVATRPEPERKWD